MNREQLVTALLDAGLATGSFQIPGVHETTPLPTDFWYLRSGADGGWEVGAFERGRFDTRARFDTESAATQWMLSTLTGGTADATR
ncbi:hypothetical protein [Nocardia mangyaensis]|uniref:hypothetical protein n=1 Tax=Nocardia mangyaensis TaxID=2213200 RepID=UPI0026766535|nr:hypothetical protein [Nocardia mangyaensis]MDO3650342.1 hypothetical protein [Nocardia mangyaensis]